MSNINILEQIFESRELYSPIQYSLIETLEKDGPLTRRELVNKLNTPRTTIYDNLIKLQKQRLVEKFSRNDGKRGRPLILWKLNE